MTHEIDDSCDLEDCHQWEEKREVPMLRLVPQNEHAEAPAYSSEKRGYQEKSLLRDSRFRMAMCRIFTSPLFVESHQRERNDVHYQQVCAGCDADDCPCIHVTSLI